MGNDLNKLQIRAKILPVIAELKALTAVDLDTFTEAVDELKDIKDYEAIFNIISGELGKSKDEKHCDIMRAMYIELIPKDIFKSYCMKVLENPNQTDMLKYQLIQTLKARGEEVNFEEFFEYLEDAQAIISYDTEKLLENAVVNPETQIDFLDFLTALQRDDKSLLIDSLADDYTGNNLANILQPVLYADFPENILRKTIEILGETKSSLAINGLEYLYAVSENDEIKSACKKSLNLLKLAGATKEKANEFCRKIMSESIPYKCYTGVPDGHYNQGILFSRKRKDGSLMMFSLVISKIYGIIDCFGFFNLSEAEFDRIAIRFAKNEIRFEVSPSYIKSIIDEAFETTKNRLENINYEFICWALLINDVPPVEYSIERHIEENVKVIELNQKIADILYTTNYLDKWFFTVDDNEEFKALTEDFINRETLTFEYICEKAETSYDLIWTKETNELFLKNIMTTVYLFEYTDFNDYAKILYSILFNEELFRKMKSDIIKKSIYNYFFMLRKIHKEFKFPTNIFRARKEEKKKEIDLKTAEKITEAIEAKWVTQ